MTCGRIANPPPENDFPSRGITMRRLALLITLLLTLTACADHHSPGEHEQAGGDAAHHGDDHGSDGIAWFDGTVDEAFAVARGEDRPLFLYWGAVWCPPCHYLKTKTFTRPEFVERTREMVPVYLDGDTERAQIYGERFGVQGYPTVILFNPAGEEITRMPSTLPVDRYGELLDTALSRMRPVKEIYAEVMETGPAAADPIDLNLLAFYSWSQDHELDLTAEEKLAAFRRLHAETPAALAAEKTRFLTLYLTAVIRQSGDEDSPAPALSEDQRRSLHAEVLALLDDPALRRSNLDFLYFQSRETVELLHPSTTADRTALINAWKGAAEALEAEESLSVDDRLSALLPRLWLTELELAETAGEGEDGEDGPALPAELVDHVRQRIAWAGGAVAGESELQAVMSTMAGLLEEASLGGEAQALLAERMGETVAPYYYMSWLAGMKREAGDTEEALGLYRQAYDTADGRYTRFRYGSIYLRQRLKLAPDDAETVEAHSVEILDELLGLEDAFAGGNHSRLDQLASAYESWNEDGRHDALLSRVRDRVHAACDRYPEGDSDAQRSRCRSFLAGEEEAAAAG